MNANPQVQITFHGVDHSDAVENRIREKITKLEKIAERIISCHVVVEAPHKHGHKGKIYNVKIDLTVPGQEIVVSRNPELRHSHEDIYVAIRDSFNEAKRQLQELMSRRQSKTKQHHMQQQTPGSEISE